MAWTRRTALGGAAGALAAMPLARAEAGRDRKLPPRLRPGDTVGLIAPASSNEDPLALERALANVRGMGLVPKVGRHVSDVWGYFSGTDADRAADVNAMFADDKVRAIFAVRGGWGSGRILPLIDWKTVRSHPKLVVGSSDITALHLAIAARGGFPTIHGPNISNGWAAISWASLWRLAFTGETPVLGAEPGRDTASPRWQTTTIHPGKARGRLLGGNLTVLSTLVGSGFLPAFDGAILFLEDVGEAEYRIDRMLNQLHLAGVMERLAGVVFGQCTRCTGDTPDYAGFTVPQVLEQYFAKLGVPAFSGANIGHVSNQLCVPHGARVEIDADAGTIRLLEPIVG